MHNLPFRGILLASVLFLYNPRPCRAYSVLTHEAIIDANWDKILLPLLKQKYPGSTEEELKNAHAYAYGGAVVPDMGFYPLGSKLFTNLIHYVRSGDFVLALINDAQNLNEYAFALGALCHYNADLYGHRLGINITVPIIYPEMRKKFGDTVTFADDHLSHMRTEFAFDVLQTARGNYASTTYHDFIGFQVARPVLERAFLETYGLDINQLFGSLSRAIYLFRWTVINLFPVITKTAWITRKDEIKKLTPTATSHNFIYRMHRKNYYHQFTNDDVKPTLFAYILSVFVRIVPKIGPLRVLKFKAPGAGAEKLFAQSFDSTAAHYALQLLELRNGSINLVNIDFDTGNKIFQEEYKPADQTFGELLLKLEHKHFKKLTPSLKQNILDFYSQRTTTIGRGNEARKWQRIMNALTELKKLN